MRRRTNARRKRARTTALLGGAAAGATAVGALAHAAKSGAFRDVDEAVRRWFAEHRHPAARAVAQGGTAVGRSVVHVPLSFALAGWVAARRGLRPAAALPLASLAAVGVQNALKAIVDRPRPPRALRMGKTEGSFPSGHATASASLAWTVGYVLAREHLAPRTVLAALAVLTPLVAGGAKLYEERHWLTDVVGGLAAGVAIAGTASALYELASRRTARGT